MRRLLLMMAAMIAVAACGSSAAPTTGTTPSQAEVSLCQAAFDAAASVDAMSDTVSDLYPAVAACSSIADWTAAYNAVNGAGFSGSATEVLGNVCGAAEVASLSLCIQMNGAAVASAEPNTIPLPASYATLTSRSWAKVVKAPDNYVGKGYKVWACISQFDAATGLDTFRGEASFRKQKFWYVNGINSFFYGDQNRLSDFVQDDVVSMSVVDLGSYSYDTQAGGNTTVPLFQVVKIARKGSCK